MLYYTSVSLKNGLTPLDIAKVKAEYPSYFQYGVTDHHRRVVAIFEASAHHVSV